MYHVPTNLIVPFHLFFTGHSVEGFEESHSVEGSEEENDSVEGFEESHSVEGSEEESQLWFFCCWRPL